MPETAFLATPRNVAPVPRGLACAGLMLVVALAALAPVQALRAADTSPATPAPSAARPATPAGTESEPAQASSAARAALEQLLGLTGAEPAAASASPAAAEARTTTTVREGETLDRIIRRTMGNTPFKDNLLQAAFVEVNPRAYPNGSIQRLPPGTVIHVPSAADLRRHLLRALGAERAAALAAAPAARAPSPSAGHTATAAARPASASAPPAPARPDHRGWVRFPG